jgi:hypothetical protein
MKRSFSCLHSRYQMFDPIKGALITERFALIKNVARAPSAEEAAEREGERGDQGQQAGEGDGKVGVMHHGESSKR